MQRLPFKCRWCGKFHPLEEFVGGPTTGYCQSCYAWHVVEIARLRGIFACCECNSTFEQLRRRDGVVRLRLVPKDGIYQLLCEPCNVRFEALKRELYAGTPYAKSRNL